MISTRSTSSSNVDCINQSIGWPAASARRGAVTASAPASAIIVSRRPVASHLARARRRAPSRVARAPRERRRVAVAPLDAVARVARMI
jgi:hypothetical protein